MKIINQLPLHRNREDNWIPVQQMKAPPAMCHKELGHIFTLPKSKKAIIYATISTTTPKSKALQASYIEIKIGDENLDLDIRHPWRDEQWEYTPVLLSLDMYLEKLGLKPRQKLYVWFETD